MREFYGFDDGIFLVDGGSAETIKNMADLSVLHLLNGEKFDTSKVTPLGDMTETYSQIRDSFLKSPVLDEDKQYYRSGDGSKEEVYYSDMESPYVAINDIVGIYLISNSGTENSRSLLRDLLQYKRSTPITIDEFKLALDKVKSKLIKL